MRHIAIIFLAILPILCFGQDIDTQWKEVDRLISIKNYQQTLPIIQAIKKFAKTSGNSPEWIRAVLAEHHGLTINMTEDSAFYRKQNHLITHIGEASGVEKSILQNMYASFLLQNINRRRVEEAEGYLSWDAKQRNGYIDSLFRISLADKSALIDETVASWKTIVSDLKNQSIAPTIYHLLAYNYLDFFDFYHTTDADQKKELIQILQDINKEKSYDDAYAYLLFRPYAMLGSWDIRQHSKEIEKMLQDHKAQYNAHILLFIANAEKGEGKNKEAMEYVHQAMNLYPNSPWIEDVKALYKTINRSSVYIEAPPISPSDMYTPIKLMAQNTDRAYVRVYNVSTTPKKFELFRSSYDTLSNNVTINAPLVYKEQIILKSFDDYNQHSTNYKINPLPYGNYKILIANNPDFKDNGQGEDVSETNLVVSDLFISPTIKNKDIYPKQDHFNVLLANRKNGSPYKDQAIELYAQNEKTLTKIQTLKTDKNGAFNYLADGEKHRRGLNDVLLFVPTEQQLIPLDYFYNIPTRNIADNDSGDEIKENALIMTDRAIYRPGQEVLFKATIYTEDVLKGKVVQDRWVNIVCKDANQQAIDTLKLSTNAFGSVHGSFRIPKNTLNGVFFLEVHKEDMLLSRKSIRVEEYKRPTFAVRFEENNKTYSKQDTVVFSGKVESLSGVALQQSTVKYRIHFRDPRTYGKIVHLDSTTLTNEDGKFSIQIALADSAFQKLTDFELQVHVEAINRTGEIQTANTAYRYSDNPLRITVNSLPSVLEGQWKTVIIRTTNPNGKPLPATGVVNIYKYENPSIIQMDRKPFDFNAEYHLLDTTDYERQFPWYFDKVDLFPERPKKHVATYPFDSEGSDTIRVDFTYTYGSYLIEAFSYQQSDTVRTTSRVNVLSKEDRKISDKDFLIIRPDQGEYSLGEKVTLHFQTDFENASGVYIWTVLKDDTNKATFVPFSKGHATYTHTITEKDVRYNTWFEVMMIHENKMINRRADIPLSKADKSLDIQLKTFRDKITPGQKETWSFTVKNKDKAVESELLATMYDTALDQFADHQFPDAFPSGQYRQWYQVYSGWTLNNFTRKAWSNTLFQTPPPSYDIFVRSPNFRDYGLMHTQNLMYGTHRKQYMASSGGAAPMGDFAAKRVESQASGIMIRGNNTTSTPSQQQLVIVDGLVVNGFDHNSLDADSVHEMTILNGGEATALYGARAANGVLVITTKEGFESENKLNEVQARANLQETAFFYPDLLTDKDGNTTFTFDSPEAMTRWRLMLFAHTENLMAGAASFYTRTQKELMVRPNLPRFLREGDEIVIKSDIQNLSELIQNGSARLEIIDPETNATISSAFLTDNGKRDFTTQPKQNYTASWTLTVPKGYAVVQLKVVAATAEFSDGEIHELAILPNRILITDTKKIMLDKDQSQDLIIQAKDKDNLQAKIQVQSNPILEIISALDYLKNYPYECNEQIASKWYGLKMIQYINKKYPAIATYFSRPDPDDTESKLESNSNLSELLITEMPWVRQIQNDRQKVRSLATLFNSDLESEILLLERKLTGNQMENGAFSWFEGGKSDLSISLRLLEIFGKVNKLDAKLINPSIQGISEKIMQFADQDTAIYGSKAATNLVLDYLYTRSLWNDRQVLPAAQVEQLRKHIDLTATYTANQPAGLAAKAWLINASYDYRIASIEVKNRITQEAIHDKDRGTYWESNTAHYNSMSLQSYMVEAYQQLDSSKLEQITQWIYYNKQQSNWQTTWNTVDAVYALLLANDPRDFVLDNAVTIEIDDTLAVVENKVLGQISTTLSPEQLVKDRTIQILNTNNRKIYGGIYHQYFLPLDKVQKQKSELSVSKKFLVKNGTEWEETTSFKKGDNIKVQLTVVNNAPLSYVHLRDSRASGFEPIYQPSGYQFRKGYYFTIKDASTNYFFDYLPKGQHVYEYEVKTNNNGTFSSGITQIECMYVPTINARSENVRLTIRD
ncbi:MG2 domain-containing protein [Sphingobacterium sp. lm-10]|uniref:alpha-2-macroglobulin family protein n=1 Tax=Sphingobacterium sp. lm-10 TaxID=2944904 RepID=UPI002020DF71|nr:alpha-2-macroglobulin family protein [Sphingobacterium sp. lm-10]MCL7989316.1 MG2 domain-containing protein [Sphingobacterium sp. lm-10]